MQSSRIGWLAVTGAVAVLVVVGVSTSAGGGDAAEATDASAAVPESSESNRGTAALPEGVRTAGQMGQYALRQLGDVDVKHFNDARELLIVGPDVPKQAAKFDGARLEDGYTVRTKETAFGRESAERAGMAIVRSDARAKLGGPVLRFGMTDDMTGLEARTDRVNQLDRKRVEVIEAEFEKVAGGPVELTERTRYAVPLPYRG